MDHEAFLGRVRQDALGLKSNRVHATLSEDICLAHNDGKKHLRHSFSPDNWIEHLEADANLVKLQTLERLAKPGS